MGTIPLVLIGILVVLGILFLILVIRKPEKYPRSPDYRALFILGITWLPIGIATDNYAFLGLGVIFLTMGLANRSKWNDAQPWVELTPEKRRVKVILISGLVALVAFTTLVFYLLGGR